MTRKMQTPVDQCKWILTYTVDWGWGEVTTRTLAVIDDADLMYRINDALLCDSSTLRSFMVSPNPAYSPTAG